LAHKGPVRVVEIPEFDCSACGGTHVHTTGEVGLIKLTRSERRGAETRVEFLCGWRALADYAAKNALVMDLAREYTVSHRELADMVHRLADDLKQTRRELRRMRDALLDAEAKAMWHEASVVGQVRVVRALFVGRDADELKHLAQRLVGHRGTVALLATGGEVGQKGAFTFACSPDLDLHMGDLVGRACQTIGGGGGGRPQFAQGGGPQGEQAAQGLEAAYLLLTEGLSTDGNARG
jgi:alanyl-tRNA synthetase